MTVSPLRIGVLGVAAITDRLLPAFRATPTVELAAIASRDEARAAAAARAAGVPRSFGSYAELIAAPDIDAVYIPLPNDLHGEWTRRAADAGKHVWCEKPLTIESTEAAEVVEHCRRRNVRLMDGFMWPHHPRTAKLRQELDAGTIGSVQKVVAAFSFKMPTFDPTVFRLQKQPGGGGLLDVGCYCIAAIRWAVQEEPVRVMASAQYFNDVDVDLTAILTFADGRTAHFDCGFSHPLRTQVEIVGTTGVIRVPNMWIPDDRATYEIHRPDAGFDQTVEVIETPGENQMVHMLNEFAAAVREQRDPRPAPEEAAKTARILDAVAEAARTAQSVNVRD